MQRYRILHRTYYNFSAEVQLGPHTLRLRPREGHALRIESAALDISPLATLRWHRDAEDNSVAVATFEAPARQLAISSDVVVQQFDQAPLDFVVDADAVDYPFVYRGDDATVLSAYMSAVPASKGSDGVLERWVASVWRPGERLQTYALLERLASRIAQSITYQRREEPGVQAPADTLSRGTGSCRDSASLFMAAARHLGLAARFASGYSLSPPSSADLGATHAWAEVFLPGAGWKGFDPSRGTIVGAEHFAVAVARSPEAVPPIAGTFTGPQGASLDVGVWVTPLP